jgi:hypothetical protein
VNSQFDDITSFEILLAPEQGNEIHQHILADLAQIQAAKGALFSSQYSIDLPDVLALMESIALANFNSRLLFDWSEYFQKKEKPMVDRCIQLLQKNQWAIGTAPNKVDIIHDKLYCDPVTGLVYTGSTNITLSGLLECNNAIFITSKSMAAFFAAEVQKNVSWCQKNQPQPPTVPPPSW